MSWHTLRKTTEDPNVQLARLRDYAKDVYQDVGGADPSRMAELFIQLDEFLSQKHERGYVGHLPEDWKQEK